MRPPHPPLTAYLACLAVLFTACLDQSTPVGPESDETHQARSVARAKTAGPIQLPTDMGPASEALRVLPPVGASALRSKSFDRSLLDHLTVSVCEPLNGLAPDRQDVKRIARRLARERRRDTAARLRAELIGAVKQEHCTTLYVASSGAKAPGLGFVTLHANQYHVNWLVAKEHVGKQLLIWFEVAGLPAAAVPFVPKAPRTVPIIFQLADHPLIRVRALAAEGFGAAEVAQALIDEFGSPPEEVVVLLLTDDLLFPTRDVGAALRDVLGLSATEAVALLADHYSGSRIAEVLVHAYGITDPWAVAATLDGAGIGGAEISQALREHFQLPPATLAAIMQALGFAAIEITGPEADRLARAFAPQLRFDTDTGCRKGSWYGAEDRCSYPMSAQIYYDSIVAKGVPGLSASGVEAMGYPDPWEGPHLDNHDFTTLATDTLPTYVRVYESLRSNQVRIAYWWYYGWQNQCMDVDPHSAIPGGQHQGDWEHVVLILNEARTAVAAVSFPQHGQWYSRIRGQSSSTPFQLVGGTHPVVYAGKQQHGSYHDDGGTGTCLYLEDWRNNHGDTRFQMDTQHRLISLSMSDAGTYSEPWMDADAQGGFQWGWDGVSTHPTRDDGHAGSSYNACSPDDFGACLPNMATKSQCLAGDTDFIGCWHCAPGYTDMGPLGCIKWAWIFPVDWKWFKVYWYDYTMPWGDDGLMRKFRGWSLP